MISKQKERLTVSLSKSNIAIIEQASIKYNKTKSNFLDFLIEKYDNDFFFRNIVVFNIGEKLREYNVKLKRAGNFRFSKDEFSVICYGSYKENDNLILRVTLYYDFTMKFMEEV